MARRMLSVMEMYRPDPHQTQVVREALLADDRDGDATRADKMNAGYVMKASGPQTCAMCINFKQGYSEELGLCTKVQGVIEAAGSCDMWQSPSAGAKTAMAAEMRLRGEGGDK